jgi:hypothetical protein
MIEASYLYLLHYTVLYFRALSGFPEDLKTSLRKMDNLILAGERMMREYTLVNAEDNLAGTERLRPPVERSVYPRGDPNAEFQLHNTPTSMLSAPTANITEAAMPAQTQFFQGASNVMMERNQINISNVQYGTRHSSKGDL